MNKDKFYVFLDQGHTKFTPGKCSPDKRLYEYKYVREIVKRIEDELDKLGIKHWNSHPEEGWVSSVNNTDSKDLTVRANRINKKYNEVKRQGYRVFLISVHVNAAGNGSNWMNASGWSVWTTKGQNNSDILATKLHEAATEVLLPKGKRVRRDDSDKDPDYESNFYILKKANCVAVLTENFFMDHRGDVDWLLSEEGKKAIVDLHIKGILKYIESL